MGRVCSGQQAEGRQLKDVDEMTYYPYLYTWPLTSNPPGLEILSVWHPTVTQVGLTFESGLFTCKWQCVQVGVCRFIDIGSV
jgi:hypothetical protein